MDSTILNVARRPATLRGLRAGPKDRHRKRPRDWWLREGQALFDSQDLSEDVTPHFPWPPLACETRSVDGAGYERNTFFFLGLTRVADQIITELPLTARRLVAEQEKLFLEVDRMQGEIDFRFTLFFPVALAVGVIAAGLAIPWWLVVLFTLLGIGAGFGLLRDGWRRDTERNDLLDGLIAIGKAKSLTFERLAQRAAQISPEREPMSF